ncbi:MAG: phosphomannomutase/phosphoglucomutase [Gammaproteobacteria bacterium]
MSFPHQIFRAYDIRGAVETALTPALTEQIGRALGAEARARGVREFVIGRDGRLSGPALQRALTGGVRASGCDVVDIGMTPTPALYLAAGKRGGAHVTASHNPPPDNGLKIMIAGETLFGDAIQNIKRRVLERDFGGDARAGELRHEDALSVYKEKIIGDIRIDAKAAKLKLVIDCGNGVAGTAAPEVFRAIGCEVVDLYCDVDGAFPNHHPDPSRPENLADLIAAVRAHRADFGLAFDGDGDRLGVVAHDGEIIWPDRLMLLFAASLLAERRGAEIIFDVKCSRLLPRAIEAHGGVATMCKTGHSFIKNKLLETGAAFAGEMSGHLFFNDRWGGFDDGIYAGARLCELLAADPRAPADIFAALPDSVNTPEILLPMREGENHKLVAELRAAAGRGADDAVISRIDGLRIDFPHGFGLARASNTTPALSLRFEADTQAQLEEIQARFRKLLLDARGDLELPF